MAIRANHPWTYNYLQLPFYTGDRFKFLPFNMYPGHRGYGAVGGSQGILPQNMLQQFVPLLNSLFGNIKFGSAYTKRAATIPPNTPDIIKIYSNLYYGTPVDPAAQKQINDYAAFLRRLTENPPTVLPKNLPPFPAGQSIVLPTNLDKLIEQGTKNPADQKKLLEFIERQFKPERKEVIKNIEALNRAILEREVSRGVSPLLLGGAKSYKLLLSKIVKNPASKYVAPGVAASGLAAWVLGPRVQAALRSNPPPAPVPPAPVPPAPVVEAAPTSPVNPIESTKLFGVNVPKNLDILLHPLSYHPMLSGALLGGLLGSIYLTGKHKKKYKSLKERLTSPEMLYGLTVGGISGAALGTAIHNYAKFMRGE